MSYVKSWIKRAFLPKKNRTGEENLATITIKNVRDKKVIGKIIASPGTKITKCELQLSYETPPGYEPVAYFSGLSKSRKLRFPYWIYEDGVVFVLFAALPDDVHVDTMTEDELAEANKNPIDEHDEDQSYFNCHRTDN